MSYGMTHAWYDVSRSVDSLSAYFNVARHIAPCICHTIRHTHGNDVIPLREV